MQKSHREIVFRFNQKPRKFPLAVRSIGHYRFTATDEVDWPATKWFCQLFWTTAGRGEFMLGGKALRVKAGDVFYHLPGEEHRLQHLGVPWSYRWVTLDHPQAPLWLEAFGFDRRPFAAGPCPEPLFVAATKAVKAGTPKGDRTAAHHAHAILLATLDGDQLAVESDSPASRCKRRMDEDFADPTLTVEQLAEEQTMHRSTLFRLFTRHYEVTPSRYLHNLRIRQAVGLLQSTNLQIQEVAWQSGFDDPNYFSRAMREATGMRPQDFRKGRK